MPNADFFTRFGLFVVKGFLDTELCARLRTEARFASSIPAEITYKGIDSINESIRRTREVKLSEQTQLLVTKRLLSLQPMLEEHFNLVLTNCEKLQFLAYKEGDFFQPHQDSSNCPEDHEYVKKRQVSVVIYLNNESPEPDQDSYSGGSLTFYGLINDPPWDKCGFPLTGEVGLLVAFRPDITHEVTPVIQGERYTIVSWFLSASNNSAPTVELPDLTRAGELSLKVQR